MIRSVYASNNLAASLSKNAAPGQVVPKGTLWKDRSEIPLEDQPIKPFDNALNCIQVQIEEDIDVASAAAWWSTSS